MKKHYFITNRAINSDGSIRSDGKEHAQKSLRFGEYQIENAGAKKEKFQLYDDYDLKEIKTYHSYASDVMDQSGSGAFFKALYKAMSSPEGGDVLFFVHGFNTDLEGAGSNIEDLHKAYVENQQSPIEHIIIFTWPGMEKDVPLHYYNDFRDATDSGIELLRAIRMFDDFIENFFSRQDGNGNQVHKPCNRKVHMMCHSMGNVVLRSAVDNWKKEDGKIETIFNEIILIAANVEWDDLQDGEKLDHVEFMGDRVHVYYNYSDIVLDIARYTKRRLRKQLGRHGLKKITSTNNNIFQVDVTNLKKEEDGWLDHWYYYKSKSVIADLIEVLKGEEGAAEMASETTKRKLLSDRTFRIVKTS